MNARLFICCAMLACSTLHARPRVIESNVRLPVDAIWVGHWGDQLIAIEEGADSSNPGQLLYTYSATSTTEARTDSGLRSHACLRSLAGT